MSCYSNHLSIFLKSCFLCFYFIFYLIHAYYLVSSIFILYYICLIVEFTLYLHTSIFFITGNEEDNNSYSKSAIFFNKLQQTAQNEIGGIMGNKKNKAQKRGTEETGGSDSKAAKYKL